MEEIKKNSLPKFSICPHTPTKWEGYCFSCGSRRRRRRLWKLIRSCLLKSMTDYDQIFKDKLFEMACPHLSPIIKTYLLKVLNISLYINICHVPRRLLKIEAEVFDRNTPQLTHIYTTQTEGVSFICFYKLAEFVVQHIRTCVSKTQMATTGMRPPLVASQYSMCL